MSFFPSSALFFENNARNTECMLRPQGVPWYALLSKNALI